jgi:glycosyltransferase involved in cell wall biosynthesis
MLSIGRAYHNKGTRHVLDTFSELKSDGVLLFMVGIHQDDPLYSDVVESGASFTGDVNYFKLPSYYSAADLLIYLPFDEESLNFAGPGYVNMESLACGTPVVSTLLRHFPDSDIKKVSRIPQEKGDAATMVKDILKRPPPPSICRSVVYKHYNWDDIVSYHMKVYSQLYRHYYNIDLETSL